MDDLRPFLRRLVFLAEVRVYELFVESLAGGDHREDMLAGRDHAFEQHGLVIGVLEEFLHFGGELLCTVTPDSVDTHRLGELDKIGVDHTSVCVSLIVEKVYTRETKTSGYVRMCEKAYLHTLPLLYHTLELVVQDDDLDANAKLRRSLKLHGGHTKRSITVNIDDHLLGCADLGANGRRKTEAHGLNKRRMNTL